MRDRSCPGSGSVKGLIDLFKKFLLGVAKAFGLRREVKSMMKVS